MKTNENYQKLTSQTIIKTLILQKQPKNQKGLCLSNRRNTKKTLKKTNDKYQKLKSKILRIFSLINFVTLKCMWIIPISGF